MPSLEVGPQSLAAVRPAPAVEAKTVPQAPVTERTTEAANPAPAVVRGPELDPGKPPIDADRVQQIRKAIEEGTYPIVPARVADAIIAAGLLLRTGK